MSRRLSITACLPLAFVSADARGMSQDVPVAPSPPAIALPAVSDADASRAQRLAVDCARAEAQVEAIARFGQVDGYSATIRRLLSTVTE